MAGQIINYDRVLDKEIRSLPTIENDYIRFERLYDIDDSGDRIHFRTILTVKQTGQIINNVVELYPLRKNQVENFLSDVGFSDVRFHGNFEGEELEADSVLLGFSAKVP